ncbi:MFS transporter [Dictyobacter alpinus]|uniref:Multidrug efflux pump Tap n=1 Tax=Dictyobacter alpinus TaxID=2014873 RepID=A0A402BJM0_9CHLR|nr:MFS transporter [Dictyobacter alpinus]GCE31548.1 MFS transporter [Dictyobacter alpinus]
MLAATNDKHPFSTETDPGQAPVHVPLYAFYVANCISLVGDRLTMLAVPWFVLQTTGSIEQTALTAAIATLPLILSSFFSGILVDRLGYKRTSVLADIASCACTLAIPLLYMLASLPFWLLLTFVFLGGLLKAPGEVARSSLLPELVREARVPMERATSISDGLSRLAGLLGAPLAALIMVWVSANNLLWLDAFSFAVSAILIGLMVPRKLSRSHTAGANSGIHRYLAELREGLQFIARDTLILSILMTVLITNLLDSALFSVIYPVYVHTYFQSPWPLGALIGVFGGAAFLGTLIYGAIGHRLPRRLTLGISFTLGGGTRFLALAFFPFLPFLLVVQAVTGLAIGPINPLLMTLGYERIPEQMRSRVLGVIGAASLGGIPIGVLLSGYLVSWLGMQMALIIMGSIYLLVTLALLVNPALKKMERKS